MREKFRIFLYSISEFFNILEYKNIIENYQVLFDTIKEYNNLNEIGINIDIYFE